MSRRSLTVLLAWLTCAIGSGGSVRAGSTHATEAALAITATAGSSSVHDGQELPVKLTIRNRGDDRIVLQTDACNYGKWAWRTDSPLARVLPPQQSPCKKNPRRYLILTPGETFDATVQVQVSLQEGEARTRSMSFRLGFAPRFGYDEGTGSTDTFWSDSILLGVAVH